MHNYSFLSLISLKMEQISPIFTLSAYNPPMHDIPLRIADVLLEVEANLRTSGKWGNEQPSDNELASDQPFCLDTLAFEQWLQWIFLPRMKEILEQQHPLPMKSGIYEYAEDCLYGKDIKANNLLTLIKRFDDPISIQSGVVRH